MTIDELIKTCKDITNYEEPCPGYCMSRTCDKCVQESEQLAEWLEELKEYKDTLLTPQMIDEFEEFLSNGINGSESE